MSNTIRNPEDRIVRQSISVKRYPGQWGESDVPVEIPVLTKKEQEQVEFEEYKTIIDQLYDGTDDSSTSLNSTSQLSARSKLIRKAINVIINHEKVKPKLPSQWYLKANIIPEVAKLVSKHYQYEVNEIIEEIANMYE